MMRIVLVIYRCSERQLLSIAISNAVSGQRGSLLPIMYMAH